MCFSMHHHSPKWHKDSSVRLNLTKRHPPQSKGACSYIPFTSGALITHISVALLFPHCHLALLSSCYSHIVILPYCHIALLLSCLIVILPLMLWIYRISTYLALMSSYIALLCCKILFSHLAIIVIVPLFSFFPCVAVLRLELGTPFLSSRIYSYHTITVNLSFFVKKNDYYHLELIESWPNCLIILGVFLSVYLFVIFIVILRLLSYCPLLSCSPLSSCYSFYCH